MGIASLIMFLIWLAVIVAILGGFWMTFAKAGQSGWGCLIPIYNIYLTTQIARRPGWWTILAFIPIVNIVIFIILLIDIATNFGHGVGFAMGLLFLGVIFWPILGYGSSQYQPAGGQPPVAPAPAAA